MEQIIEFLLTPETKITVILLIVFSWGLYQGWKGEY